MSDAKGCPMPCPLLPKYSPCPFSEPSEGYSWDKDLKESMGSMLKEFTFISTWEDRTTETESIGI
jgi:hypothetical protein